MGKGRLEAFSDGVLAIIITIMVLELKVPHGADLHALEALAPKLFAYAVSFIYVGIYWANHHHLLHLAGRVNGGVLWANLHLLFWLSLIPVTTDWIGENPDAPWPSAIYGAVLLMGAIAYYLLQGVIRRASPGDTRLGDVLGRDLKGRISPALYLLAIALAFWRPWAAQLVYTAVALMWLVPDRRIERAQT